MQLLVRFAFDGLVTGCIYLLVAVGFGLIYQTTGIFHFAHAAVFSVAAYVAYQVASSFNVSLSLAIVAATLTAMLLGALMHVLVYGPLVFRGGSILVSLISAIGLTSLVQGILGLLYGETPRRLPFPTITEKANYLDILKISPLDWITLVSTVVLLTGILVFMHRSRFGREIRAVGTDVNLARAFGLNIRRAFLLVFVIGSGLLGPAAVLAATQSYIRPTTGVTIMLVASIAVFVGGVGNLEGAAAAAVLIGMVQYVSLLIVPGTWQNTLTFGTFLILMLLAPEGVFTRGRGIVYLVTSVWNRTRCDRLRSTGANVDQKPPDERGDS